MKFGRYLKDHALDEWRGNYLDYRMLKKAIHRASNELNDADALAEVIDNNPFSSSPTTSASLSLPVEVLQIEDNDRKDLLAEQDSAILEDTQSTSVKLPFEGLGPTRRTSSAGIANVTSAPVPSRRPSMAARPRIKATPSSLFPLSGEVKPKYFRFEDRLSIEELLNLLPPRSCELFITLDTELRKVSKFWDDRERDAIERYREIKSSLDELENVRRLYAEQQEGLARGPNNFLRPIVSALPRSAARFRSNATAAASTSAKPIDGQDGNDFVKARPRKRQRKEDNYAAAKTALKLAAFEFYRSLGMLKSYGVLNQTGFAKILKKVEKETRIPCLVSYTEKIALENFVSSKRLDELIAEVEKGYATSFSHGDRKTALENLRNSGSQQQHHFVSFKSGMYIGVALTLLLDGVIKSTEAATRREVPYWPSLLQLFGAIFLPVFFSLLFSLNLLAWHSARINYVLIFELDIRTMMDFRQYIELPALLMFIFSLFFWLSFSNFWPAYIAASSYPLAFIILVVTILFSPFPLFYASGRWWMIRSAARVACAGLIRVEFRDFFIGDEIASLYYTFYNFGYLVCVYQDGWSANVNSTCSTNMTWLSPFLASLPSIFRLGQSIRRFVDSDGVRIHAFNAGKYSATICYFYFYFNWRINGSGTTGAPFIVWIIFAVFNSVFGLSWDISLDWGLGRRNENNFYLRPVLGFKEKNSVWFYYIAVVTNVILRFSWVIYLPTADVPSVQLRGFIVAFFEVLRRIQWNTFRVESEHLGNVDAYRVTRTIALPYLSSRVDTGLTEDVKSPPTFIKSLISGLHDMKRGIRDNLAPVVGLLPEWPEFDFGDKEMRKEHARNADDLRVHSKLEGIAMRREMGRRRAPTARTKSEGTVVESSSDSEGDDDEL